MGLFKSIGKIFKKAWSGIKKRFKKVLKSVGKFLNSGLGKVLLLAVSVFTMGAAFIAAQGAFAAASAGGASFVSAFIEGGKAFVGSLLGKGAADAAPEALGQGVNAAEKVANMNAAQGALTAGDALQGVDAAGKALESGGLLNNAANIGNATTGAGMGSVTAAIPNAASKVGAMNSVNAATTVGSMGTAPVAAGNWLSQAAGAAGDFVKGVGNYAKTGPGQQMIGNVLQGYSRGAELDAYLAEKERGARSFDPGNPGRAALDAHDFNVNVPDGLSQNVGRQTGATMGGYTQRIPYQQQNPIPTPTGG